MAQYDYSKATVNVTALEWEIQNDEAISKALEKVNWTAPDSLSVFFEEALSGGEETALDALVAAHTGEALNVYDCWDVDNQRFIVVKAKTKPTESPEGGPILVKQVIPTIDRISVLTMPANTDESSPVVKSRVVMDSGNFRDDSWLKVLMVGRKAGGGSGYIRFYNYSKAVELAVVEFDSGSPEIKEVILTGCPGTDKCILECQIYTDGTGTMHAYSLSLEAF